MYLCSTAAYSGACLTTAGRSFSRVLREMLNRLYDNFTERFGRLNDKRNLDLIKMDARGTEILSLERYIDGKARKADIFERPVAFNPSW